jgi:hypothetical protein
MKVKGLAAVNGINLHLADALSLQAEPLTHGLPAFKIGPSRKEN